MGHETLYWAGGTHANFAIEALGGAPYGATQRLLGGGDAAPPPLNRRRRHWGFRWSWPRGVP
eukprot:2872564-Pyramimonas_sp.AAC.1